MNKEPFIIDFVANIEYELMHMKKYCDSDFIKHFIKKNYLYKEVIDDNLLMYNRNKFRQYVNRSVNAACYEVPINTSIWMIKDLETIDISHILTDDCHSCLEIFMNNYNDDIVQNKVVEFLYGGLDILPIGFLRNILYEKTNYI